MLLEKNVESYLKKHQQTEKPLLLGFSGGEDSLALSHCFIRLGVNFHIAHYDHAWRETSAPEAEELQSWATQVNVPFHTRRSEKKGANELAAREERYAFFQTLFQKIPFEALVLAHHREDQIETILKRVLEGAHLTTLRGMRPTRELGQMAIWRPLLGVSKEAIIAYLQKHQLKAIDDPTNRDPKYLRARMRTSLVPMLKESFGKEIGNSLIRIGHYSAELENYLQIQTEHISPVEGPFGMMWDFSKAHPIEIRFLLRKQVASQNILEKILGALTSKRANYLVDQKLIVDRGHLFVLRALPPKFPEKIPFSQGIINSNGWEWEIQMSKGGAKGSQNWRDWWQGKISFDIPYGNYEFEPLNPKFRKRQNAYRVPAFLRDTLPIITSKGKPIGEFLTGKSFPRDAQNPLSLSLKIKCGMMC